MRSPEAVVGRRWRRRTEEALVFAEAVVGDAVADGGGAAEVPFPEAEAELPLEA